MTKAEMFDKIAEYCIDYCAALTTTGNYYIEADEIAKHFNLNYKWLSKYSQTITDRIDSSEEVIDVTDIFYDDHGNVEGFELWLAGNAVCKRCKSQNTRSCNVCDVEHPEEWNRREKFED